MFCFWSVKWVKLTFLLQWFAFILFYMNCIGTYVNRIYMIVIVRYDWEVDRLKSSDSVVCCTYGKYHLSSRILSVCVYLHSYSSDRDLLSQFSLCKLMQQFFYFTPGLSSCKCVYKCISLEWSMAGHRVCALISVDVSGVRHRHEDK